MAEFQADDRFLFLWFYHVTNDHNYLDLTPSFGYNV